MMARLIRPDYVRRRKNGAYVRPPGAAPELYRWNAGAGVWTLNLPPTTTTTTTEQQQQDDDVDVTKKKRSSTMASAAAAASANHQSEKKDSRPRLLPKKGATTTTTMETDDGGRPINDNKFTSVEEEVSSSSDPFLLSVVEGSSKAALDQSGGEIRPDVAVLKNDTKKEPPTGGPRICSDQRGKVRSLPRDAPGKKQGTASIVEKDRSGPLATKDTTPMQQDMEQGRTSTVLSDPLLSSAANTGLPPAEEEVVRSDQKVSSDAAANDSPKKRKKKKGQTSGNRKARPDLPKVPPKKKKDGTYARPAGRAPNNCTWDRLNGLWISPTKSIELNAQQWNTGAIRPVPKNVPKKKQKDVVNKKKSSVRPPSSVTWVQQKPIPKDPPKMTSGRPSNVSDNSQLPQMLPSMVDRTLLRGNDNAADLLESTLVLPKDRELIPASVFVAMTQLKPCRVTRQDRIGSYKNREVGFLGLCCKHCGGTSPKKTRLRRSLFCLYHKGVSPPHLAFCAVTGQPGFGRYFPAKVRSLAQSTTTQTIFKHLTRNCRFIPFEIRNALIELQRQEDTPVIQERRRYGSRKVFFQRVWTRLHGAPEKEYDNDDEDSKQPARKDEDEDATQPVSAASSRISLTSPYIPGLASMLPFYRQVSGIRHDLDGQQQVKAAAPPPPSPPPRVKRKDRFGSLPLHQNKRVKVLSSSIAMPSFTNV
jgi:hypothetical protein